MPSAEKKGQMKIEFTGRRTEVPAELRRLAERKLQKLGRVLPGITRAHVILIVDRHRQTAEISVHSRHLDLVARETSDDLAASVGAVVDKLTRQAQRQVGRRRERGRPGPASARVAAAGLDAPPAPRGSESRGVRVIRSRRSASKPMTVDEAAAEMLVRDEGFLVFRDARTERVHVLYRRKDGNLGLIEPEV
jgi:putative sigma-54 modulation protein